MGNGNHGGRLRVEPPRLASIIGALPALKISIVHRNLLESLIVVKDKIGQSGCPLLLHLLITGDAFPFHFIHEGQLAI